VGIKDRADQGATMGSRASQTPALHMVWTCLGGPNPQLGCSGFTSDPCQFTQMTATTSTTLFQLYPYIPIRVLS
jgi:hypothetical protein